MMLFCTALGVAAALQLAQEQVSKERAARTRHEDVSSGPVHEVAGRCPPATSCTPHQVQICCPHTLATAALAHTKVWLLCFCVPCVIEAIGAGLP